jgi:glutathione S-transferase
MPFNLRDPAFHVYAGTVIWLCLHMVLLDAYGGVARVKTKTVVNPEDAASVAKGADIVKSDPDTVARVMRAHRNLLSNGVPFLLLCGLWMMFSPSFTMIAAVCGTFVVARLVHSIAYVREAQPFRTLSFVVGQIAMVVVVVQIARGLLG